MLQSPNRHHPVKPPTQQFLSNSLHRKQLFRALKWHNSYAPPDIIKTVAKNTSSPRSPGLFAWVNLLRLSLGRHTRFLQNRSICGLYFSLPNWSTTMHDGKFMRVETRSEWRSICKECHQTAAKADYEEGLIDGEARHQCPDRQARRSAYAVPPPPENLD